jgi:hypothetical protein
MKLALQFILCVFTATAFSLPAQSLLPPSPIASSPAVSANLPPQPKLQSPITFFRQLLAMNPAERNATLTNRPPEARAKSHAAHAHGPGGSRSPAGAGA